MKITFIGQHGVEVEPARVGEVDYRDESEFMTAVRAEHHKQWYDDDSHVGYADVLAANEATMAKFLTPEGRWVEYLTVPFGYLVLSK